MNKKLIFLILAFLTPVAVWAHNPGGAMLSMAIVFILSLTISLFLLKFISRSIKIDNKFLRFLAIFFVEIGLLISLYFVLSYTLGIFIYIYVFGG